MLFNRMKEAVSSFFESVRSSRKIQGFLIFILLLILLPFILVASVTFTNFKSHADSTPPTYNSSSEHSLFGFRGQFSLNGSSYFNTNSNVTTFYLQLITKNDLPVETINSQLLALGLLFIKPQTLNNSNGSYPSINCFLTAQDQPDKRISPGASGSSHAGNGGFTITESFNNSDLYGGKHTYNLQCDNRIIVSISQPITSFENILYKGLTGHDYNPKPGPVYEILFNNSPSPLPIVEVTMSSPNSSSGSSSSSSIQHFNHMNSSFAAAAPACPQQGDARTYVAANHCDSSTGLGYNTAEGGYTCGPVACPGDNSSSLPHGNTCIYSEDKNGQTVCFAGYGDSASTGGFNPSGCHYNPADNGQAIACPSSIDFKIHVNGLVSNASAKFLVNDNGLVNTYTTNGNGDIVTQSYSGDSVVITHIANDGYTITPPSITSTANTTWSCGTSTGKYPCTFTVSSYATPTPSVSPIPTSSTTPAPTACPSNFGCPQPKQGCFYQKVDKSCGCGTLVCPSPTPTVAPSPVCQKECPALPSTCHYASQSTCCIPQADGTCACSGVICQ